MYGCSLPTQSEDEDGDIDANSLQQFLAPKDVQPIDFTPKDNNHGIGYSGVDPNMFLGAGSLSGVFKPTGSEKRGIRGQVRSNCYITMTDLSQDVLLNCCLLWCQYHPSQSQPLCGMNWHLMRKSDQI